MIEVKVNTEEVTPEANPQVDEANTPADQQPVDGQSQQQRSQQESVPETPEEAKQMVEDAGLDFDKYYNEFAEKGRLSEESYQELASKGITKEIVDAYIAGQQALAEKQAAEVYKITGGEAGYNDMIQWASSNLTEKEIEAYNQVINSGDMHAISLAVEGLYARYSRANAKPHIIQGLTPPTPSLDVYNSLEELKADMSDPRYSKDPAFRRRVEEKLARSDIL